MRNSDENIEIKELHFPCGGRTRAVLTSGSVNPRAVFAALDLRPRAVLTMSGGAAHFSSHIAPLLNTLLRQVLPPLLAQHNVMLIDGGTAAGVMKLLGEILTSSSTDQPILVGFAPRPLVSFPGAQTGSSLVPLDPNHPYQVLIRDALLWGEELPTVFAMLDYLESSLEVPVVSILINGGRISLMEAHGAASRNRPLIVIEGSGRLSDIIVALRNGTRIDDLRAPMRKALIIDNPEEEALVLQLLADVASYSHLIQYNPQTQAPTELHALLEALLLIPATKGVL